MFWRGIHKFKHLELAPGGVMIGMEVKPPTTDFFVDYLTGDDGNSGRAWGKGYALETIQEAMDRITARGAERGRCRVFVAPGGYSENIITPLDSIAPFGQLIAVNPTKRAVGAVWLSSPVATSPVITVRARGWLIDGFEIDAPETDGCIYLEGVADNCSAKYTEIANCLFSGFYSGSTDFGVDTNEASVLVVIRDSIFFGFASRCITASTVVTEQWEIKNCIFLNSANYIAPKGSKGFAEASIHDCVFHNQGGLFTAALKIDMRVGRYNNIGPNNFLGGTYDHAGGYYASSTDEWRGNACEDSYQKTNPA